MTEAGATAETSEARTPKRDEPPRLIKQNSVELSARGWGERGLKHAVTEFLNNLLSGAYDAIPAPYIAFGTMTLKLRRNTGSYIAYGEPTGDVSPRVRIPARNCTPRRRQWSWSTSCDGSCSIRAGGRLSYTSVRVARCAFGRSPTGTASWGRACQLPRRHGRPRSCGTCTRTASPVRRGS